jgi:glycosyltransferase involved in cell wall biosynthesis
MLLTVVGPVYPFRGGIAHHTTMLVKALSERNHQVMLVSFRRQYPSRLYPGRTDRDPSLEPLRVDAEYILDPIYPWTWLRSAERITLFNPRAVVIPWWTTFWAPAYWCLGLILRNREIPIIFLVHNVIPHEARWWDAWVTRQVFRFGKAFLVQNNRERERLLGLIPEALIGVSPHPIYPAFNQARLTKQEARSKLGLPPDNPLLLFFGIVRPYKGLDQLIEAAALLIQRKVNINLLVAGEFWEKKSAYLDQIQRLSLSSRVSIHDKYIPNEEVGIYFSAADLFIAPYIGGTQSGAVKLALGFGLPAIISDRVTDEILINDSRVRIVPTGDPQKLADAIEDSLNNKLSQPDKPSTKPQQSWHDFVEEIENILTKVT